MTSNHISEELPRLLTGDATRDVVLAAAEHLRVCPDCQQELVSAVVAHASLASAHRFAPEVVAPQPSDDEELVANASQSVVELPSMDTMFAKVRDEAAASAQASAAAAARRPRRRLLAVAAAAVILAGGGLGIAELTSGSETPARQVALTAFDRGSNPATASIKGSTLTVDASSLPSVGSHHRYEVWLTDSARRKMQPVGFIGDNKQMSASVPSNVLDQYNDIEVSVQGLTQSRYSGISVLRGAYG